jgi:hypothetical protein
MPKKFFTDIDIEELHRKGVKSLQMNDDIVLTDLAYEKAKRLDIQLTFGGHGDTPPTAPVRPYLLDKEPQRPQPIVAPVPSSSSHIDSDVAARIRSAVLAKLGNQVDTQLLDNIIKRVVKATGLK